MKKQIKIVTGLIIGILILTSIWFLLNNKKEEVKSETDYTTERTSSIDEIKDETKIKQGELTFSEIKLSKNAATNVITGKVKNEGQTEISCKLNMKMYGRINNRIVGIAETNIENLKQNEEKAFEIVIIGDYATVVKFGIEALDIINI